MHMSVWHFSGEGLLEPAGKKSNATMAGLEARASTALWQDFTLACRVSVPVLITSQNAAEREQCARLIHSQRRNGNGPFVTFRSHSPAALGPTEAPAPVISDRFENGSLRHQFDRARRGTLFIDDIATLTSDAQLDRQHGG
jgi:DNA-binding NtrC family response regulator